MNEDINMFLDIKRFLFCFFICTFLGMNKQKL